MPRPYPNRPRKRKGRPPPNRHRGPRPQGFTSFGLGSLYDSILPDVRGPDRRTMFNQIGDRSALLAALTCGAVGLASGGIAGAVVGFFAGYVGSNGVLVGGRFIRR